MTSKLVGAGAVGAGAIAVLLSCAPSGVGEYNVEKVGASQAGADDDAVFVEVKGHGAFSNGVEEEQTGQKDEGGSYKHTRMHGLDAAKGDSVMSVGESGVVESKAEPEGEHGGKQQSKKVKPGPGQEHGADESEGRGLAQLAQNSTGQMKDCAAEGHGTYVWTLRTYCEECSKMKATYCKQATRCALQRGKCEACGELVAASCRITKGCGWSEQSRKCQDCGLLTTSDTCHGAGCAWDSACEDKCSAKYDGSCTMHDECEWGKTCKRKDSPIVKFSLPTNEKALNDFVSCVYTAGWGADDITVNKAFACRECSQISTSSCADYHGCSLKGKTCKDCVAIGADEGLCNEVSGCTWTGSHCRRG